VRRVVVTGLGAISPTGNTLDDIFANLMAGKSSISPVTIDGPRGTYSNIAGAVAFDPVHYFSPQKISTLDRTTQLALAAASAAIADSNIHFSSEARFQAGVYIGTGVGAANTWEQSYVQLLDRDPNRLRPLTILTVMTNAPASHIAMEYGLEGPNLTFTCACASSAVAIGEAYRQIKHGYTDTMIAGGTEAMLTFGLFKAWDAMRVLALIDEEDPSASCRPFSKNRSGLVLGEGASVVVLEERERAVARGAKIYGELVGYGSSNDASHITKPSVEGQARAMTLALADAGISPDEIGYINAHGTATSLNDVTETLAIKHVFGERATAIPISATKSMHGHLLGAAGALEFLITMLALQRGAIPPTAHLDQPDPACDLDYVANQGRQGQNIRYAMSNSFAFGGTNAVLIARS